MNRNELDRLSRDPENWRFYFFYFCPRDPRIVVPKRWRGLGWTVNTARPLALPFTAGLIAGICGVMELAARMGTGVQLAAAVVIVLGVCAVCYRMANPADDG